MEKILFTENIKVLFEAHNVYLNAKGNYGRVIGKEIFLDKSFEAEPFCSFNNGMALASIGSFSYFNSVVPFRDLNMVIGRYCSVGDALNVLGPNHPMDRFTTSPISYERNIIICTEPIRNIDSKFEQVVNTKGIHTQGSVVVGNDVWIGARVTLSRGVSIGHGAVIAAESVVTKNVPPYAVVGGNPARIIKFRFSDDIILELLNTQWWKYKFSDFEIRSDISIEDFVRYVSDISLEPFSPKKLTYKKIMEMHSEG